MTLLRNLKIKSRRRSMTAPASVFAADYLIKFV